MSARHRRLLAVMAGFYAVFHGPEGLKAIAQRIHRKTARLAEGLKDGGFDVRPATFFDTITVEVGPLQASGHEICGGSKGSTCALSARRKSGSRWTNAPALTRSRPVWRAFGIDREDKDYTPHYHVPETLIRTSAYLTHPVFHMNRAETEMMRYMRRLADRDLALDRAMIPLGSCTMKLNSAAEMMPVAGMSSRCCTPMRRAIRPQAIMR